MIWQLLVAADEKRYFSLRKTLKKSFAILNEPPHLIHKTG